MKIFWSWQSDTPGKVGRHFVRGALAEAIEVLRQPSEIEEPSEREAREALHLDHDRQGVSGSPDLAPTIFRKIEQAAVFVADVTLVGETTPVGEKAEGRAAKKLINSNVAIEYGYAHHALSDARILMVQNTHFGERDDLPFDLKHKGGPIQYSLAPGAPAAQIVAEKAKLRGNLVTALRPYLISEAAHKVAFQEVQATSNPAVFFDPSEVLARVGVRGVDEIEYRFSEPRVFYLRLIPTRERVQALKFTELYDLAQRGQLDVLSRVLYTGLLDRNHFGAIKYEPHGTSATPQSFTQTFTSGEIWGVTTEFFVHHQNEFVVPPVNVENIYGRVLKNYCLIAKDGFGIEPPYQIELGAVGLRGTVLGINTSNMFGPIHQDRCKIRRILKDATPDAQQQLIGDFLDALFDLAGEDRKKLCQP